ncbi:MAG: bifunctional metallophosphatase/5'-nucleotidase [Pyrinomonadaceae bacterium]|nr:bifunctional metallophosphatase/5'-nucleotidase [Pyrinomonadaceae bacterium]
MKFLAALVFVVLSAASAAFSQAPIKVTILHVNDVYSFAPVDGGTRGGLARLLTLKQQAMKENPNTIFTLGGDTLSPSVETLTYKGAQMIDAWNAVGLDYSVFGNHEFDLKTPVLLERMKESKFRWLGANIIDTETKRIFADTPKYVIVEYPGGVKVGIIGLILPETKETSSMGENLMVADYCETAKKYVPEMRKEGANAIVGLTHLFMAQDKKLAQCADFDLILGGHEHTLLQSSSNGTPIFKMTADARELGKFDLNFDPKTRELISIDWQVIPVTDRIADSPDFAPVTAKYKDLLEKLAEPIGRTAVVLDAGSASNRTQETNVGNFIADAFRRSTGADIGFLNGGSIRADLTYNPGSITKRDVLSMLPFNNPVVKIEIGGKTLREVLEHGVARSAEDPEPGRFPQVSGLTYKYDLSKPAGSRIVEAKVGGMPIEDGKTYTLATSSFLVLNGGDGYTMFKDAKLLIKPENAKKDAEILEDAIKSSPEMTISPKIEGRIVKVN